MNLPRRMATPAPLSDPPDDSGPTALGATAALLHRGQTHEADGQFSAALACYNEALATLPATDCLATIQPFALAWMNRANVLQKIAVVSPDETTRSKMLHAALSSYSVTLALLAPHAPGGDPALRNSLGAAWLNCAAAQRRLGTMSARTDALRSLNQAIALLASLPSDENPAFAANLAGARLNRATLLLELAEPAFFPEAGDLIDDALALVRRWDALGLTALRPLAAQLVRVGAILHAAHQPHFLADFLRENFTFLGGQAPVLPSAPVRPGGGDCLAPPDAALFSSLRAALDLAERRLRERWLVPDAALSLDDLLTALDELRVLRIELGLSAPPSTGILLAPSPSPATPPSVSLHPIFTSPSAYFSRVP